MPNVAFVAPYLAPATLRFAAAMAGLDGVRCGLITQMPLDQVPPALRARLDGHWQVADALDPAALARGVRGLAGVLGSVDRLTGILEHLQVPLAEVRDALDIPGLGAEAARNFRDKARMKNVLAAHGLPCARHHLAHAPDEAIAFARACGFPLVVKPPAGAGAISTYRVENEAALRESLAIAPPRTDAPLLLEEFLAGDEHSFDSVMLGGRLAWYSCSRYHPSPLEVLEHPWIQWCVLLPREISGEPWDRVRPVAERSLQVLGLRDGMSHMEWFRRRDGSIAISEVGARPPGAQFTTLLSWAHDLDFYAAWARIEAFGTFDPPPRRYAVGAAYFRGQGAGRISRIHGLEDAQRELGPLVVEASLPAEGRPPSSSYEGDGYAILRHPDTAVVERALHRLVSLVRVEASEGATP